MAAIDQQAGALAGNVGSTAMKWMRRASLSALFLSAAAFAPGSEQILLTANGVNAAGASVATIGKLDMLRVPLEGASNILGWGGDAINYVHGLIPN